MLRWIIIAILASGLGGLGYGFYNTNNLLESAQVELSNTQTELTATKTELDTLKKN